MAVSKAIVATQKNGTGYLIIYIPYGFIVLCFHWFENYCYVIIVNWPGNYWPAIPPVFYHVILNVIINII